MNELSLVISSVCIEAAVGIMCFLALSRLWNNNVEGKNVSIAAGGLAIIGVLTSITHLGQPVRAFNALSNIGSSWMSRETVGFAVFTACCVLCAGIYIVKPAMKSALSALEWASALIGVVLLYIMGNIYTFASVPSWHGANTLIEYFTSAIMLGAVLFFAITFKQQDKKSGKILAAAALAALAVQLVGSELHMAALGAGSDASLLSAGLLNESGMMIAAKWILLVGGIGAFCINEISRPATQDSSVKATGSEMAWISAGAVCIALFVGKVLFFSTMVTTGIGRL